MYFESAHQDNLKLLDSKFYQWINYFASKNFK